MTDLSKAQVGDKIWHVVHGWGVISDTSYSNSYPVVVDFINNDKYSFDLSGKQHSTNLLPSLYWEEQKMNPDTKRLTIIDLAQMRGSDIDMEFVDEDGGLIIGPLSRIHKGLFYTSIHSIATHTRSCFKNCRVRESHWHSWSGGDCPLPEGLDVEVRLRNEQTCSPDHDDEGWSHEFYEFHDIIAFKVLGVKEGYTYG